MSSEAQPSLWTGPRDDPNRYRVDLVDDGLVEVGAGGEGLVYEATRPGPADVHVALKLYTSVPIDVFSQIESSARLLAGVEHPNLMRQIETFTGRALGPAEPSDDEDFSVIYSAAEWIDGEPLDAAVERHGTAAGLRWVGDVSRALAALHEARAPDAPDGVVHGDVKPSNVRVTPEGSAKLIDFGFSRAHDANSAVGGVGTYRWRAPELVTGERGPSPASDVWGIGALAYWVVVGEPPALDVLTEVHDRLTDAALEKGFVNATELASHVATLLEADPARRVRDLGRWADELDRIVQRRRHVRWLRRPALVAAVGALIGVIGGICLTLLVQSLGDSDATAVTPGLPGSVVLLARPFAVPDSRSGEQVLRQDEIVVYRGGPVFLSGSRDGEQPLLANDEVELQVTHADGAVARFAHNFGASSDCQRDEPTPPQDVTNLFAPGRNIVRVIIRGGCNGGDVGLGGFAGAGTPLWMVFGS